MSGVYLRASPRWKSLAGSDKLIRRRYFTAGTQYSLASTHLDQHDPGPETSHRSPLRDRHCLVTGGTSGIGYEIVKALVSSGTSSVQIVSRDAEKAQRAITKIQKDTSRNDAAISVLEADLGNSENVDREWERKSSLMHSVLNTLIYSAGLSQSNLLVRTSIADISKILTTNLEASIILSRRFLKDYYSECYRRKRQNLRFNPDDPDTPSFCIVNISSVLAIKGGYASSVYAASKAGLVANTRALTLEGAAIQKQFAEFAPPFRANVVLPGYIDTPMTSGFAKESRDSLNRDIPLHRFGKPAEVADAVMFLLRNEYANNTVLNLDGGLTAI